MADSNKLIIVSLLVWLLPILAKTQLVFHGSYFVAAICKDGIVIGADTRQSTSNPFDSAHKVAYYTDTIQKVYKMDKYAMALMGDANSLSDTNWRYFYIKEFRKHSTKQYSLQSDIDSFFNFLKKKYSQAYKDFSTNVLAFASFDNGIPIIYGVYNSIIQRQIAVSGFLALDPKMNFQPYYNPLDSCNQMAKKIEKAILEYAEKNNLTERIGGLITILKISPTNEMTWLTPTPLDEGYCTQKEFMKAVLEGRVKSVIK